MTSDYRAALVELGNATDVRPGAAAVPPVRLAGRKVAPLGVEFGLVDLASGVALAENVQWRPRNRPGFARTGP